MEIIRRATLIKQGSPSLRLIRTAASSSPMQRSEKRTGRGRREYLVAQTMVSRLEILRTGLVRKRRSYRWTWKRNCHDLLKLFELRNLYYLKKVKPDKKLTPSGWSGGSFGEVNANCILLFTLECGAGGMRFVKDRVLRTPQLARRCLN